MPRSNWGLPCRDSRVKGTRTSTKPDRLYPRKHIIRNGSSHDSFLLKLKARLYFSNGPPGPVLPPPPLPRIFSGKLFILVRSSRHLATRNLVLDLDEHCRLPLIKLADLVVLVQPVGEGIGITTLKGLIEVAEE